MSDADGESSDRTAQGSNEDDDGVKVSIPDDFSDSTSSPDHRRSGSDRSSSELEEVGKEELFVDAPDQYLEDSVVIVDERADTDGEAGRLRLEVAALRSELGRSAAGEDLGFREFEEELRLFHSQLQLMINRRRLMGETTDKMADQLSRFEEGVAEVSPLPLAVVVGDCSEFTRRLKLVIDEQGESERAMRELHAALYAKDQEADGMFTKMTELSISSDILASHMVVVQKECSSMREELDERSKKEVDLIGENRKLLDELGRANERFNVANMQLEQKNSEMELGETKLVACREKLSMAVTKGKALVQERNSLRQSVNEKTSELEKYLQDLMKSQDTVGSLQESLSEKNKVFQEMKDVLTNFDMPVEVQSLEMVDRVKWILDRNCQLDQKVEGIFSSVDMPETIKSSDLESRISWLVQSNKQAREDVSQLVDKVADMQVSVATNVSELSSAHLVIKRLEESLSHEQEEKDLLQARLDELTERFDELSEKFSLTSAHRDIFIKTLHEISGIRIDDLIANNSLAEIEKFSDGCIVEIKEKNTMLEDLMGKSEEFAHKMAFLKEQLNKIFMEASEISLTGTETHGVNFDDISASSMECYQNIRKGKTEFEKLAGKCEHLEEMFSQITAEKDWLLEKCYDIIKSTVDYEDDLPSADLNLLFDECIGKIKENNRTLEDVKTRYEDLLLKESSEKSELVKKLLELSGASFEDNTDRESSVPDNLVEECMVKIHERIRIKNAPSASQFEQFQTLQSLLYLKSQEVMLYEELFAEELTGRARTEKLCAELSDKGEEIISLKNEKDLLMNELRRAEDKSSLLREKLSLAVKKGKGMVQEREGFKLAIDQKTTEIESLRRDLQHQQSLVVEFRDQVTSMSDELQNFSVLQREINTAKEEQLQMEKLLAEKISTLQLAFGLIENISMPTHFVASDPVEKLKQIGEYLQELQAAHSRIREEAGKAESELHAQTKKFEDCCIMMQSVKDALAQAEGKIYDLNEEREELKRNKTSIEQELENVRAKGALLAARLADGQRTISSLEESLSLAENAISVLEDEKREIQSQSQQETVSLQAKCAGYAEELSGSHGRTENQFSQLVDQLNYLRSQIRNENPLVLVSERIKRNIEGLRKLVPLVQDVQSHLGEQGLDILGFELEDIPVVSTTVSELEDDWISSQDGTEKFEDNVTEGISSYVFKYTENLRTQNKLVNDSSATLCSYMDRQIEGLAKALGTIKDQSANSVSTSDSLKLQVQKFEAYHKDKEDTISRLSNSLSVLLSSCRIAEQDLQVAVSSCYLNFDAEATSENRNPWSIDIDQIADESYVEAGAKLLTAVRLVQTELKQLEDAKENWLNVTNELRNELYRTKVDAENSLQEKALHLNKISAMGKEINSLQQYCSELKAELESSKVVEEKLREKEKELSFVHQSVAAKEEEMHNHGLSRDHLNVLFSKVNDIYVSQGSKLRGLEGQFPSDLDKLFYILDNFREVQQVLDSVNQDQETLQFELATRCREIGSLKEETERLYSNNKDLEEDKYIFIQISDGLKVLVQKLGLPFDDGNVAGAKELLSLLEKFVVELIFDSETMKKNYQELSLKFQENKTIADGLSEKVKLLESSLDRQLFAEPVQERSIYEFPPLGSSSEILEIEDGGQRGKNKAKSPVSAAPVARTLRKGSSDHLALNIVDSESDRLIEQSKADSDKGHVFKSLNTSGLIPKHAKSVADRIDGIWVSGGRLLMRRPEARIGLIAYWLLLHFWILGSIL